MSLPKPSSSSAALITGASAGIGLEIARQLAARGHSLVLVARRKERLRKLADELSASYGVRAETIASDLTKEASRRRIPGRLAELGLDVEILINNAGFATNGRFDEADPDRELEQVRVLVEAPVALTSAFLPGMVERGRGAILNVASTAGDAAACPTRPATRPRRPTCSRSPRRSTSSSAPRHHRHRARARTGGDRLLADLRLGGARRADVRERRSAAGVDLARAGGAGRDRGARGRPPRGRPRPAGAHRDAGRQVPAARGQAAGDRVDHAPHDERAAPAPDPTAARRDQRRDRRPAAARRGRRQGRADHRRLLRRRRGDRAAARGVRARPCCSSPGAPRCSRRCATRSPRPAAPRSCIPCDLADTEAAGRLAEQVLEQHGHVDVVVSNAGLSIRRWISQSYDRFRDIERTINVNYLGPVRLLLGLLPSMRERGSGHIVNVATIGVDFPPMRWSAYIASKAALRDVARRRRAGDPRRRGDDHARSTCSSCARRCSARSGCGTTCRG